MRAPPLLLLLLMAAAGQAVNPLAQLNPWLSACDLEEQGAGGRRECGVCGGGGGPALAAHDVERLCKLTSEARTLRLRELRLRTCCERSPASALDHAARKNVTSGGTLCTQMLHHLLELDAMVARVHCDFVDILDRYDCDQSYSVHTCNQCQETYRRWACSTMVPFWVEEDGEVRSRRAPVERGLRWHARHLERVGHLDRRRRGGLLSRWVRAAAAGPGRPEDHPRTAAAVPGRPVYHLKPCLSVCQLVETHCPYFLPADRAPAYPTQYAGEPTFLCLDARIPETGVQANKSNYGPADCCYWHCQEGEQGKKEGQLCEPLQCKARLVVTSRPQNEGCSSVEERVATCAVPYQAAGAAPAHAHARPLLSIAAALLLLAAHPSHWTAPPLVTVRGSRL